jgi:hypothetical protein
MAPSTSSRLGSSRRSGRLSPPAAPSPKPGSPLPLSPGWPPAGSCSADSPAAALSPALAVCSPLSPGNSPWGNCPRSPSLEPDSPGEPLEDWLPDSPWLLEGLPDDSLALLEEELLLEELLDELLEELLEELLLGGGGLLLLGGGGVVGGGCGVVGLLALGQPLSSRQAQATPPSLRSRC